MQERGTPQPGCSTPARPATCNVIVACVLYDRDRQLSVLWMLLGLSCGITYRIVHFVVSTLGSQHRTRQHYNISGYPQRSFCGKSEVPDSMRSNNNLVPFCRAEFPLCTSLAVGYPTVSLTLSVFACLPVPCVQNQRRMHG